MNDSDYPILRREAQRRGTTQRAFYAECREAMGEIDQLRAALALVSEALLNPKELTIDADGVLRATPLQDCDGAQ